MKKIQHIVGEDVEAVERIIEQVSGLIRDHGVRILKYYRKTQTTMAVKLNIGLKGDNHEMSCRTSINYTEEKVSDFASNKINLKQGTFDFGEDGQGKGKDDTASAQISH